MEDHALSGLPEKNLDERVLDIVRHHWPISALEVAAHFRENAIDRESRKRLSGKYAYYLKKLVARRLVLSKRVGHALVVWPIEAEKYRTIHSILRAEGDAYPQ